EGLRRRGALAGDRDVERADGVAEPKRRQGRGGLLLLLNRRWLAGRQVLVGFGVRERLPAKGENLSPGRGKALTGDLEFDARVEEFVRRVELRQVPAANELVDGALGGSQLHGRARSSCRRWNDAVVRADLRVVPRLRAQGEVRLGDRGAEGRGLTGDGGEHFARLRAVPLGQEGAVRARIREQATRLVE